MGQMRNITKAIVFLNHNGFNIVILFETQICDLGL